MKKLFPLVAAILFLTFSCVQEGEKEVLDYKIISGVKAIKPDIESTIYLYNLPVSEWKKLIEENGFIQMSDEGLLLYTLSEQSNEMVVMGASKNATVMGLTWTNFETKELLMGELALELEEYLTHQEGNRKYYTVEREGNSYIFSLDRNKEMGVEDLLIQKITPKED